NCARLHTRPRTQSDEYCRTILDALLASTFEGHMSFMPRALSVAIFFGLSVGGLSLACSSAAPKAAPPFDAAAESAKLMARDAHWADLATAGKDVDSVVAYWTDDAVIVEPGQPVVEGKAAIRK